MSTKHPMDGKRNADMAIISKIADRAVAVYAKHDVRIDRTDILLDITCCHFNAQPLRLDDLLAADEFDFAHDISKINRHLDRGTCTLTDGFSPRFSLRGTK